MLINRQKPVDLDQMLAAPPVLGRVDRTVGDCVFYVRLLDGEMLGLQPERLLVRRGKEVRRYRGESFSELGLANGLEVEVYSVGGQGNNAYVLIDPRPSLFYQIFQKPLAW